MNKSTFDRAMELMVHFKSVYPDDTVWQMARALAEKEERYSADIDTRMKLWRLHTDRKASK